MEHVIFTSPNDPHFTAFVNNTDTGEQYEVEFRRGLYIVPEDIEDRDTFVGVIRRALKKIPGVEELDAEAAEAIMRAPPEPEPEPPAGYTGPMGTDARPEMPASPQGSVHSPGEAQALQDALEATKEQTQVALEADDIPGLRVPPPPVPPPAQVPPPPVE